MAARVDRLWLLAPLLLASIQGAEGSAGKGWTSGTFIYADLCTESGERIGRRITLRRSPNGNALTYEAAVVDPVRIEDVSFEDETQAISFALETNHGPVTFRGRMEGKALIGIVEDADGAHDVRLPRVLRAHADQPCHGGTTGAIAGRR